MHHLPPSSCNYLYYFLTIIGVTFILEVTSIYAAHSSNKGKGIMDESDSRRAETKFGCAMQERKVGKMPVWPTWANNEVPPLTLTEKQYKQLKYLIEKINRKLIVNQNYNTIDNFIRFRNDYIRYIRQHQSMQHLQSFFADYKLENPSDSCLNIAILEEIIKDKEIKKNFPQISESVFLASTFEAGQNLVRKIKKLKKIIDVGENDEKYDDSILRAMTHFKHITAVIKFTLIENMKIDGTNGKTGFILLDPERNWKSSITVMQDTTFDSLLSGYEGATCKMNPYSPYSVLKEWVCPELEYADEANVITSPVRYQVLTSQRNLICPHVYSTRDHNTSCDDGSLIFVGKPYCSYVETTEKYKLLSPYCSLMKRYHTVNDTGAIGGIFAVLMKSDEPTMVAFHPDDSKTPFSLKYHDIELKKIALATSKPLPPTLFDALRITDYHLKLREDEMVSLIDVPLDIEAILRPVSKVLNLKKEELIQKVRKIRWVLQDDTFMGELEFLRREFC